MVKVCCVQNCTIDKENKNHLFCFPKDEASKSNWLHSIGSNLRKDKGSRRKQLFICQRHFTDDCFNRNSIKILKDGKEICIPRQRISLQTGRIPSIFKKLEVPQAQKSSTPPAMRTNIRELSPYSIRKGALASHLMFINVTNPVMESAILPTALPTETAIKYSLDSLVQDWNLRDAEIFPRCWGMIVMKDDGLLFSYNGDNMCIMTRSILVKENMNIEVRAFEQIAHCNVVKEVTCLEDLRSSMMIVSSLHLCARSQYGTCKNGFFVPKPHSSADKCTDCLIQIRIEKRNQRRKKIRLQQKTDKGKKIAKNIKNKYNRCIKKIKSLQGQIEDSMSRCAEQNEESINIAITDLPMQMQEVVKQIHKYGKQKDHRGIRYSRRWILECLLLSIKSRKSYLHLRNHNILPLPTLTTLRKYLRNLKPEYGFDPQLFSMLEKKAAAMKPEDSRGALVLDEMSISEGLSFDTEKLSVVGFTGFT